MFVSAMGLGSTSLLALGCRGAKVASGVLPDFSSSNPDPFWAAVRNAYPLTRERVYLNCGGLGPAPSAVLDAVAAKAKELQTISETGHAIMDEVREVTAEFLGADPEEICFTRNATESNSIISAGLILEKGDEVIIESHAHPGGFMTWLNRQNIHGIRVKIFDPDPDSSEGSIESISNLVTPRTRVIQVSHITAPTGILFDVKAIARLAREKGIWFHLDGAQSAGMIPVDLHAIGCHSYATSGHKWMGGPRGTGILYIAKANLNEVECSHVGSYTSGDYGLPGRIIYYPAVKRHEYGTRNTELVEGLKVAMELQRSIGCERIEAYGKKLASYLHKALSEIDSVEVLTPKDPELRRSITTFKSAKVDFETINNALSREYKLRCRRVSEQGLNAVRVSTHIYNSKADCDQVIAAVEEIVKKG